MRESFKFFAVRAHCNSTNNLWCATYSSCQVSKHIYIRTGRTNFNNQYNALTKILYCIFRLQHKSAHTQFFNEHPLNVFFRLIKADLIEKNCSTYLVVFISDNTSTAIFDSMSNAVCLPHFWQQQWHVACAYCLLLASGVTYDWCLRLTFFFAHTLHWSI